MRAFGFAFIGVFLLLLALSYPDLYRMFPEIFKPVYNILNSAGATDILYIAGVLALIIAFFSWLPPWLSWLLFIALTVGGGYLLTDNDIHLRIDSYNLL
ncbi:hypothetical protein QUF74_03340 [Candidatus Halobeggiatoa sp. HSG11]|nr:hypothetical protein [Candidatus Halobeggiatoa sp. HSG11]